MLASLDIFNGLQATLTREVTTMRNVGDFSELDAIADGGDMGVFNTEQPVGNSTIGGYGSGFGSKGTNFDSEHLVTAVDDVKKTEDREAIPEWGQTLTGRVDKLEGRMERVEKNTAEILRRLPKQ